jgi:CelD/BcsL family acetyltransferase involved in cellulose biosynthesis
MPGEARKHFIEILSGLEDWSRARPDYLRLYRRSESSQPFHSPEWVDSWIRCYGKQRPPVLLQIRNEKRELELSWLFFRTPALGGFGLWPVMAETADLLEPLEAFADPGRNYALVQGMLSMLQVSQFLWAPLVRASWVKSAVEPELATFRKQVRVLQRRRSTNLSLFPGDENPHSLLDRSLGGKSRKMLRQAETRLKKEGPMEVQFFEGTKLAVGAKLLEDVERRSWQFGRNLQRLTHPTYRPFFQSVLKAAAQSGSARIGVLFSKQQPVAADLCLLHGQKVALYETVFDQSLSRFSPGRLLLRSSMLHAFEQGAQEYDFLQGEHGYKQQLANRSEPLIDLLLTPRHFKGWLHHALVGASSTTSRWMRFMRDRQHGSAA